MKIGTFKNDGTIGVLENNGTISTVTVGTSHVHDAARHDVASLRSESQVDLSIIFLSSNCEGERLAVDREFNRVHQRLSDTNPAWARCLEHWPDVSLDQLATRVMRSTKPTILHFGGHGDRHGRLMLRDHRGEPIHVEPRGLCRLIHRFASSIRLVVLNACFSEVLAKELASNIDVVIGMHDAIEDETAILFSQSFYEGLATNLSVDAAFDVACGVVIARCPEVEKTPSLLSSGRVDPSKITFGPLSSPPDGR
jgi:hypothetical protein